MNESKINDNLEENLEYKIDRSNEVDKFIKLIESEKELKTNREIKSFNIALSGFWGSGKTTFINDVIKKLDKDKYEVMMFNAWDYDYWDNPGVSIIEYLNSKERNWKNISIAIGKDISKLIIKWEKLNSSFSGTINALKKDKLSDLLKKIELKDNGKKVIFIIDDLDRCKTDFVIKLIEVIKHILNVENVILIALLNWNQLSNSIDNLYGISNNETEKNEYYLDKIFDLRWDLPTLNAHEILRRGIKSKQYSIMKFGLENNIKEISIVDMDKEFYSYNSSIRKIKKDISTYNNLLALRNGKLIYEIEELIFELIVNNEKLSLEFLDKSELSNQIQNLFREINSNLSWHLFFYLYLNDINFGLKLNNHKIHMLLTKANDIYKLKFSPTTTIMQLAENTIDKKLKIYKNAFLVNAYEKVNDNNGIINTNTFIGENKAEQEKLKIHINNQANELKKIFIEIINEILTH